MGWRVNYFELLEVLAKRLRRLFCQDGTGILVDVEGTNRGDEHEFGRDALTALIALTGRFPGLRSPFDKLRARTSPG